MRAGSEDKDTLVSAANKANRQRNNIVLQAYTIMYTKKGWISLRGIQPFFVYYLSTCVWYRNYPIPVIILHDTCNHATRYR